MKKRILIISVLLVLIMLLVGTGFAIFSTVTYRGVIVSSTAMDDYVEFIILDEKTNEHITILADVHTAIYYCHHERDIYIGDIMNQPGCTVEINCRRFCNQNHYSESIVVQFSHENGNDAS